MEGYDTPPMIMMGHARPYYADRILAEGYKGVKDLLAYRLATDFTPPEFMGAVLAKASGIARIRPLRGSRWKEDLQILRDIFEDAWSTNWGFMRLHGGRVSAFGEQLATVGRRRFCPNCRKSTGCLSR